MSVASVSTALHAVYSPPLVVASFLIAALASYTALDFAARVTAATRMARAWWLAGGAVALGLGIWGMHFVGMLAVRLYASNGSSLATAYDVARVILSIVVAVAAAALALWVSSRAEVGRGSLAGAALVMGVGIAGMHYIGMASMRVPGAADGLPGITYRPALVGLAYAIAAGASLVALWLARRAYRERGAFLVRLGLPAVIMGLAIAGMHYTGMASATFHPILTPAALNLGDAADVTLAVGDERIAGTLLATPALGAAVTIALFFVLAFTLIGSTAGRWAATAPLPDDLLAVRSGTPTPPRPTSTPSLPGDNRRNDGRGPGEGWRAWHMWRREADALDAGGPSLRTKLAAGSAAAGLVLVVALVAYWGFDQFEEASSWLAHTSQVRASVQALETAVSEAEASGRAYLLYGRPRYVDQYRAEVAQTERHLTTVRRLTADNQQQQRRLDRIDPLFTRRFSVIDSLIALRQRGGANAVLSVLARRDSLFGVTDRGLLLADSLHSLVSEVDGAEAKLYERRSERLATRSNIVTVTLLGGSLVAFTLILLILQAIRRDVAAREAAQSRVREQGEALAVQAEQLEQQQTELKQQVQEQQVMNAKLADANHQLERSAWRHERLIYQLERSNQDLDQFAYVASHDLKAPLRGIVNLASWIEEDLAPVMTDDTREQMHLMRGRVHRMEALIDGILQYSRAGRVRTAPEPVDTAVLVADVVELIAPPEGTQIIVAENMPKVLAERVPLQQVFMNLIGNAMKYARRADAPMMVRVSWTEEPVDPDAPRLYRFSIADNGPGIAPQYHERVFGIFQTLQSRDQVEGTGIGLSVVKKIVEGQGGRVWVESAEGEGATFHFTWPAAPVSTTADV